MPGLYNSRLKVYAGNYRATFGDYRILSFLHKLENKFCGDWITFQTPTDRIQSMNQIAAVSEALQKSYKEVLKKTAHVADGLDEIAKKRDAISKIQSSVLNSGISASLSDPSFYQQNKDYQDYLKSYNSPYSFKQYDLTETALNNSYKEFKKSINDGKIRAAIESAKTLLNQRNRNLRSEADKNLYPYFSDGIFQTSSINQNRNSLFDKSKFATNRNTPEGQALRNIINKAQSKAVQYVEKLSVIFL